jgi:hypothetical protein
MKEMFMKYVPLLFYGKPLLFYGAQPTVTTFSHEPPLPSRTLLSVCYGCFAGFSIRSFIPHVLSHSVYARLPQLGLLAICL